MYNFVETLLWGSFFTFDFLNNKKSNIIIKYFFVHCQSGVPIILEPTVYIIYLTGCGCGFEADQSGESLGCGQFAVYFGD